MITSLWIRTMDTTDRHYQSRAPPSLTLQLEGYGVLPGDDVRGPFEVNLMSGNTDLHLAEHPTETPNGGAHGAPHRLHPSSRVHLCGPGPGMVLLWVPHDIFLYDRHANAHTTTMSRWPPGKEEGAVCISGPLQASQSPTRALQVSWWCRRALCHTP